MYILGISAFYHDSAACLIKNGEIIAAAQEERFTRKKLIQVFLTMRLSIVYMRQKLLLIRLIMLLFMKSHF